MGLCCICYSLANVSFEQPVYDADDEDNGPAQPVLVLSNPLSRDIIVQVNATDGSATGQYFNIALTRVHYIIINLVIYVV